MKRNVQGSHQFETDQHVKWLKKNELKYFYS